MDIPERALRNALQALQGRPADAGGHRLLSWLGWDAPMAEACRADRLGLLRVALRCVRVFGLEMPSIPGLCTIGAHCDPTAVGGDAAARLMHASGVGLDPGQAFAACMGEAAERLAQVETAQDRSAGETMAVQRWPAATWRTWPRALLLRQPGAPRPPAPLSIGCAAGPSLEAARRGALLEVIERDAVALWWRGGLSARHVPTGHPAAVAAAECLARLGHARVVHLLDIGSDLQVPVIAALSFGPDGVGFCCGTAARPGWAEAARAAVLEMCQNQLAVALAAAKQAADEGDGFTPRDAAHLARYVAIRAADCWRQTSTAPPGKEAPDSFDGLAAHLDRRGWDVLVHAHRRDWLDIPVVRVIVPGLSCEPSDCVSPRLAQAIGLTGGGIGMNTQLFA